jgi:hypothetical protein
VKDKYEDPSVSAQQIWLTIVGKKGYLISFWSTTSYFDNPEISEVRDHFIKSIKFLDINSTQISQSSRFD